MGDVIVR